MNHPGFTSLRLADMRRVFDEVPMSDRDRRIYQSALNKIEAEWQTRHQDAYGTGLNARDDQHDQVIEVAGQFSDLMAEAIDDVRNGRRSPTEVRSWLRDVRNDFQKLTQQHEGIEISEGRLAGFESMDLADFQADQLTRFPPLANGMSTLAARAQEIAKAREVASRPRQNLSREQMDADQDALARALRRFSALNDRQG